MQYRQTFTLNVTSQHSTPADQALTLLEDEPGVAAVELISEENVEVVRPGVNRYRLIGLAVWAAGEQAKADLGLPSEWDQGLWLVNRTGSCGTACCIAGKVAIEDGGVPVWNSGSPSAGEPSSTVRLPGRGDVLVEEYAAEALGLDDDQADMLFSGDNDLDAILRIVGELIEDAEPAAT